MHAELIKIELMAHYNKNKIISIDQWTIIISITSKVSFFKKLFPQESKNRMDVIFTI